MKIAINLADTSLGKLEIAPLLAGFADVFVVHSGMLWSWSSCILPKDL